MINRLAALADIVPPRPVAPPSLAPAWRTAGAHPLPALVPLLLMLLLLLVIAAAGARRLREALRRSRARRELLRTLAELRAAPPEAPIVPLVPRVLDELCRAGLPEPQIGDPARHLHQSLLYEPEPRAELLRDYLEQRLSP